MLFQKHTMKLKRITFVTIFFIIVGTIISIAGCQSSGEKYTPGKDSENKPVTEASPNRNNDESVEEPEVEEQPQIAYTWLVDPTIEADDIYYVPEYDLTNISFNEMYRQFHSPYAVIKKGDALGLLDMNGELKDGMDYKKVNSAFGHYTMERIHPTQESDEEFQPEWSYYSLIDDEIVPDFGMGDFDVKAFYYCDGLHEVQEDIYGRTEEPAIPIPVKIAERTYSESDGGCWKWWGSLDGKYAIYFDGALRTEAVYDKCGSYSDGLIAISKDGKWGYVNAEGEEVIPIEYDASWKQFEFYWDGFLSDKGVQEYCYACSDNTVALCKDGKWELRDNTGKVLIPTDIFEEIRPAYDKKCWVKKDGKWGIILINSTDEEMEEITSPDPEQEPKEALMSQEEFEQSINGENVLYFLVEDYDGDGEVEAFALTGDKNEDGASNVRIYFISSNNAVEVVQNETYGYFGGLYENNLSKFIVWERSAGGSGSTSFIYGVKNGRVYELEISGQYMDFHKENEKYVGYTSDFSKGYHDYIPHYFIFDDGTGEFVMIKE